MENSYPLPFTILVDAVALMALVYVPTRFYLSFTEVARKRYHRKRVLQKIRQLKAELRDPLDSTLLRAD